MRRISSTLAILWLSIAPMAAKPGTLWMNEDELRTTFGGQSIDGHYQNGSTFSETYQSSGRVAYRDERRETGGRWSIVDGAFCTIYDDDPTGGCFRVMRSGDNCYEFYFVARTEEEARTPRNPDWSARGWLSTGASTCTEGANV
ncbi:MAG: hypothetical protein ACT4N2_02035 [Hyphomicrobium sp.]